MADDEFNFDFETSLEPPQNNQQVSFDLTLWCFCEVPQYSFHTSLPMCIRSSRKIVLHLFATEWCAYRSGLTSWSTYRSVDRQLQEELSTGVAVSVQGQDHARQHKFCNFLVPLKLTLLFLRRQFAPIGSKAYV